MNEAERLQAANPQQFFQSTVFDADQGADGGVLPICARKYREHIMPQETIAVVVFVIAMFGAFMLALAWANRKVNS